MANENYKIKGKQRNNREAIVKEQKPSGEYPWMKFVFYK